jgi:hypothetical protein
MRFSVQANLGKKQNPFFRITRAKIAGGMAEELEYLSSKHKALN